MPLLDLPQVLLEHVAGMLCEREFYRFSLAAHDCRTATAGAVGLVDSHIRERREK